MRHAIDRTLGVLALLLSGAAHAGVIDGTWQADMSTARLLTTGPPQVIRLQDGQYACRSCDPPLTIRADGTDQPVAGALTVDAVSIAALDERTVIETRKLGGKTVAIRKFSVSDDGGSAVSELSDYAASGAEVTSRQSWTRQSAGPPGSHAVSGSWVRGTSLPGDKGITVTFQLSGNALAMRTPIGSSYAAPLNGDEAPYVGDPDVDSVSVRQIGAREFEEEDRKAGKAVRKWHWTFDATGRTGHVTWVEPATHTTTRAVVRRVD
jgi:hypothetical protein